MSDRQGMGLAIVRICLGVFLLFMGVNRYRWFFDTAVLAEQLGGWMDGAAAGSISRWYLETIALPGVPVFARLVPLAEIASGVALIVGFWTPIVAFLSFLMVLNFAVASGVIFTYAYLTNGYGLPVLGGTLGLAVGAVRLPLSVK